MTHIDTAEAYGGARKSWSARRSPGDATWCERHGVAVTGYSPFGHGNFPDARSDGGAGVLAKIAEVHDATPRQVALAFLTRHPSLFAISKAS